MKRIKVSVLLLLLLIMLPAVAAIYKWTDANGVVHFSDQPHSGAKQIHVGQPTVVTLPPVPSFQPSLESSSAATGYERFAIIQPEPEATVRNNPGTVTVRFAIEPELRRGHRIQVLLDGQPVKVGPVTSTTMELHSVYRGTHTVSAVIKNSSGEIVARAKPITFYMHRPSVYLPAGPVGKEPGE